MLATRLWARPLVAFGSIATEMARPRRVPFYLDSGLNGRNANPSGRGLLEVRGGLLCRQLSVRNPVNKCAQT